MFGGFLPRQLIEQSRLCRGQQMIVVQITGSLEFGKAFEPRFRASTIAIATASFNSTTGDGAIRFSSA